MSNDEFNDDLDLSFYELDAESAEIDKLISHVENACSWLPLLDELSEITDNFIRNMESLEITFDLIRDNDVNSFFLKGTIWVGIISAYEGFLHDMLHTILQKKEFFNLAQERIPKLDIKIKNRLNIKNQENLTKKLLEDKIREATLNNPSQGAIIMRHLFDFPIQSIE